MFKQDISPDFFERMFMEGNINPANKVIKGIPEGYILVGVQFNNYSRITTLYFDKEVATELDAEFTTELITNDK